MAPERYDTGVEKNHQRFFHKNEKGCRKHKYYDIKYKNLLNECLCGLLLFYGCECWITSNEIFKKLETTVILLLRRMLRKSCMGKKTKAEALRIGAVTKPLISSIRSDKHEIYGAGGIEKLTLYGPAAGLRGVSQLHESCMLG